jgi:3-hydroxyisobutyrate dehydrogenase-like beta-hydroxyacid dehydrogenase
MRLGFVGVGTMGAPIARRLVGAGHEVHVVDPVPVAVAALADHGAIAAADAVAAASGSDVVFLSLPGPDEVRAVVIGDAGILRAESRPRYVVDLSTNSPDVVAQLATACSDAGVTFVDAPVSGGVAKAEAGELSVMVGATDGDHAELEPLLTAFASVVFLVGPTGAGTIAKLVNNQLFLGAAVVVQEAYLLAAAHGLEPTDLHPIIKASSAGPYAALAPLLLGRRFDDVVFRLDIAAKDLSLAVEAADAVGVATPVTAAAAAVYADAVGDGFGRLVFHATLKELEQRSGREVPALVRRRE